MSRVSVALMLLALALLALTPALADGHLATIGTGPDQIKVVVVSGTPYEMGYSYGSLLADDIKACMGRWMAAAKAEDPERCTDANLDAAWEKVKPYVKQRWVDELRGIADGAGVDLVWLRRAHCTTLLGDYSCSGVAVWGPASANGHLYQIRNLDFTTDAGLQDYPVITVYLPKGGIPHATVGFAGYAGCHAGINAEGIALTEKGATPAKDYPFDLDGVPFFTLFRDILEDAHSLDEAVSMVQNVKRHKKYYYVIGDGDAKAAVKMNAFAPNLLIQKDNDPNDEFAPNVRANLVYVTMDNAKAWQHLNQNYGKYDADKMIELSKLVHGGGNLVNVVYDATSREMWVAYAEGTQMAWQRPYVHFALADYLPKQ